MKYLQKGFNHSILFFYLIRSLVIFSIVRTYSRKIILIDFDFTLVNNHFDYENGFYLNKPLEADFRVINILEEHKDYYAIIFTARGFRTVSYIKKNLNWNFYFEKIIFCGSTKLKFFIIRLIHTSFDSIVWIDDLADIHFESKKKIFYDDPPKYKNLKFMRWKSI